MSFKFSTECEEMVVDLLEAEISRRLKGGEIEDFTDMELKVREALHQIGQKCLERTVNQQEERSVAEERACSCGEKARCVRRRADKSITVFGEIWYKRAYYVCAGCGQGQSPLDKRLGIEPGQISAGLGPLLALWVFKRPLRNRVND